jgi:integrase
MHTGNRGKAHAPSEIKLADDWHEPEHNGTGLSPKTAKPLPNQIRRAAGKNDSRYWYQRIFRPVNDRGEPSPHYCMRTQFKGRRVAFSLGTGNKDAAARRSANIYTDLLTLGVDGTLAKHRPQEKTSDKVATIGEWIEEARSVSAANPATFALYAAALRKIAGDILKMKRTKKRFGPKGGGAKDYRKAIDAQSLEILSPEAIQKWRIAYVKRAKTPTEERSRKISCDSTVRQARSLFSQRKVLKHLSKLRLPDPKPFNGVEFYFGNRLPKYRSRIDAKALLTEARNDVAEEDSPAFLVILLALAAGLRKGEIDTLCWHQIDFGKRVIRVEITDEANLKTDESEEDVPIDTRACELLRGFHARATGAFVIEHGEGTPGPRPWGRSYRAQAVFDRVTAWLRQHGVTARKPLHELRKECGALIVTEHGIYAAQRFLRHAQISTTANHYSDQKKRTTIPVGEWLEPENVVPMKRRRKARAMDYA